MTQIYFINEAGTQMIIEHNFIDKALNHAKELSKTYGLVEVAIGSCYCGTYYNGMLCSK